MLIICILTLLVSLTLLSFPIYPTLGYDSSIFLYSGRVIRDGGIMYKDVFDHKGPMMSFVNSIVDVNTLWFLEFAVIFVCIIIAKRIISKFATEKKYTNLILICFSVVLAFFLETGNLTEEYALIFVLISLEIFVDYLKNGINTTWRWIVVGMCAAVSFLFRANLISLWISIGMFLIYRIFKDNKCISKYMKIILYMFFGFVSVIIVTVFYFWENLALNEMIYQMIIFNLKYVSQASFIDILKTLINLIIKFVTNGGIVYFIITMISKEVDNDEKIFITIYMIIAVGLSIMAGRSYSHYFIQIVPVFLLSYASFTTIEIKSKRTIIILTTLIMFVIYIPRIITRTMQLSTQLKESDYEIIEILKRIEPEYCVQNFANPYFYIEANIKACSRYATLPSLDFETNQEVYQEIQDEVTKQNVDYILYNMSSSKIVYNLIRAIEEKENYEIYFKNQEFVLLRRTAYE